MEEKVKKGSTLPSSNKSNIKSRNRKKVPSSLSNEELLEQILAKKKKKVEQRNSKSKTSSSKIVKSDTRTNEEILEAILSKKRRKKIKGVVPSSQVLYPTSVKIVETEDEENKHSVDNSALLHQIIQTVQDEQKRSRKKTYKNRVIVILFCIFIFFSLILFFVIKHKNFAFSVPAEVEILYDNRPQRLKECMEEKAIFDLSLKEKELSNYLSSTYKVSVSYEDITSQYTYGYRADQLYYAASTIKALDALYIYTYASYGEIDLNTTIKYTSKYKRPSNKGLSKYSYGSLLTLRELVSFAIIYSDNSAREMLLDFIGKKNLREFGLHIGALHTLSNSDSYGYLTSFDGLSIMRGVSDFIKSNEELGTELQSYFLMAEQNDLEIPTLGIKAAHKYGEYEDVYHDIGIVYDTYPYIVAIFTKEGNKKNHEDIVKEINSHVYAFHKSIYEEKEAICKSQIYK